MGNMLPVTGFFLATLLVGAQVQQGGPLAESDVATLLDIGVPPARLEQMVQQRGISFTLTPSVAARLKAKGASDHLLAALRAGTAAPSAMPTAASGPRFTQEEWGMSLTPPAGWKLADQKTALLLGSDTEPGLILVRLMRQTNRQALMEGYGEGLQEEGLQLMPVSQIEEFRAGSSPGLAGEMAGATGKGERVRARIIAVLSPFGDAALVLGLTTEDKYTQLKPRVDALAATISFTRPKAPPVNLAIAGQYIYFYAASVGPSYSRQELLNLCSNGLFNRGGETYFSSDAGALASQGGSGGRWSTEGSETQGVLILNFANGRTDRVQYRKSGGDLVLDGSTYARYGDGTCRARPPF